jgi:hypothetical protein
VLVKELQGLNLRVDLVKNEGTVIDAEEVLETSIEGEAAAMPTIDATSAGDPLDVTVADEVDEFGELDLGDGMTVQTADDVTEDDIAAAAANEDDAKEVK